MNLHDGWRVGGGWWCWWCQDPPFHFGCSGAIPNTTGTVLSRCPFWFWWEPMGAAQAFSWQFELEQTHWLSVSFARTLGDEDYYTLLHSLVSLKYIIIMNFVVGCLNLVGRAAASNNRSFASCISSKKWWLQLAGCQWMPVWDTSGQAVCH